MPENETHEDKAPSTQAGAFATIDVARRRALIRLAHQTQAQRARIARKAARIRERRA